MKGSTLLVIALGGREIKPLTDHDVVRKKVASHCLISPRAPVVQRNHVDDPGGTVNANDEGIDPLERQQYGERDTARYGAQPPAGRDTPGDSRAAPRHADAISVPAGRLAEVPGK